MRRNHNTIGRPRRLGIGSSTAAAAIVALGLFSSLTAAAPSSRARLSGCRRRRSRWRRFPAARARLPVAADDLGILRASPDKAAVGTKFKLTGSGLPAGKTAAIVWVTSKVDWVSTPGRTASTTSAKETKNVEVVLATTTISARGALDVTLMVRVTSAAFTTFTRWSTASSTQGRLPDQADAGDHAPEGPVGTPIAIAIGGLAPASTAGQRAVVRRALRRRGHGQVDPRRGDGQDPRGGPVGKHTVLIGTGMQFNYLNVRQSPIPWATGGMATLSSRRTPAGRRRRSSGLSRMQPTVDMGRTAVVRRIDESNRQRQARARLDERGGRRQGRRHRLGPRAGQARGARVGDGGRQPRQLHRHVLEVRVGTARVCHRGHGRVAQELVRVPDNLGGWHVVRVVQDGQAAAQIPYHVKRSVVGVPRRVKAGRPFQVHLKGVGWTQLDNTVAVTYDNSYVGYGCGFNSNGDVVLDLVATGGPGTHLIDVYPLLYPYQPAYPYPPHARCRS